MTEVKTKYVLEIPIFNPDDNFQIAKDYFKTTDRIELIKKAQNSECDILGLKFNVIEKNNIQNAVDILKELTPHITKPLLIGRCGDDSIDGELLPELIKNLNKPSIISSANENTYQKIISEVIKGGHSLVLKTPIDVNLCKELNILAYDLGLPADKIITDTDIGGLGYGLDYGYSTIEKIKLSKDKFLNTPVISYASSESLKTKEAKFDNLSQSWGKIKTRAKMFELAASSAVKAAGADIIVLYHPDNIKIMKGLDS